jgi:hypothetical protein
MPTKLAISPKQTSLASMIYMPAASVELPRYLQRLQSSGYAHTGLLLSRWALCGNSPPDDRWLGVIALEP